MRVLVIEDDPSIAELVGLLLGEEGHVVQIAPTGREGIALHREHAPDLVLLDVRLPDMDGFSVCRELRLRGREPILILSNCSDDVDKIVGLEVGADDYLTKPFNPRELVARVRALLRRSHTWAAPPPAPASAAEQLLSRGSLALDLKGYSATLADRPLDLTTLEFTLLRVLVQHAGQVLTRQQLLDSCWGADFLGDERTVDGHIRNLRAKLKDDLITTIRGIGYKFIDPP